VQALPRQECSGKHHWLFPVPALDMDWELSNFVLWLAVMHAIMYQSACGLTPGASAISIFLQDAHLHNVLRWTWHLLKNLWHRLLHHIGTVQFEK